MAQPIEENEAVQLISEFLQKYPDEEWGCGHNVLSDHNLLNSDIEWCIQRGEDFLVGNLPDMDYHPENTGIAVAFLRQLLTIPEDERVIDFYGE